MPQKILLRKKTKTTTTAPSPRKIQINPLPKVLASIDLGEGQHLSPKQIESLTQLTFSNGDKILSTNHPSMIIDVIDMLRKLPIEEVIIYLQNVSNAKEAVLNSPLLEDERERVRLEVDNVQSTIEAEEGIYQCEGCGEQRTLAYQKQVRSADEPMTTFVRCLSCGKQWRID